MYIYLLKPSEYATQVDPIIQENKLESTFIVILDNDFVTDLYINKQMNMLIIKPDILTEDYIPIGIGNNIINFLEQHKAKYVSLMVGERNGKIETIAVYVNKKYNNDSDSFYNSYPRLKYNSALLSKLESIFKASKHRN